MNKNIMSPGCESMMRSTVFVMSETAQARDKNSVSLTHDGSNKLASSAVKDTRFLCHSQQMPNGECMP